MIRRILLVLILILAAVIPAGTAHASTTDRLTLLAAWTQPTDASITAWNAARRDRDRWASYNFDWATDYCSGGPDKPLGFNFVNACWHHDFGYRNYKAAGQFPANKARVDDAFYAHMRRVCQSYSKVVRPACYSVAWTYYQAVRVFGASAKVQKSDLKRAEALLYRSV
jgi:hypothetical protein